MPFECDIVLFNFNFLKISAFKNNLFTVSFAFLINLLFV